MREFAKLGEPRTWFDLQGAAAYLALSEQTLSRYVKENTAPLSVKVGKGRLSSQ
jgi:predicted DNA-binding transcriptional regulator AlpA